MKQLARAWRSVVQYFQGAYAELRRVTWPTRQAVVQYTVVVVATIIVGALLITAFDYGLQRLASRYLIQ